MRALLTTEAERANVKRLNSALYCDIKEMKENVEKKDRLQETVAGLAGEAFGSRYKQRLQGLDTKVGRDAPLTVWTTDLEKMHATTKH